MTGECAGGLFLPNETPLIFLLTMYGKNEKGNPIEAERNALAKLVPALAGVYTRDRGVKR